MQGTDRLARLAATASLTVAVALALAKAGAVLFTGSLAVLASLIDSLADIVASAVTYFSVRISHRPPDRSHRYGHGKAEALSALLQAALVAGSAAFVLIDALRHLANPVPLDRPLVGLGVIALAIAVTGGLVAFQHHVVRRTGSLAIRADSVHYAADLLTNLAVVASLGLVWLFGWTLADPIAAALVALWLLWHALKITRSAVDQIMDRELPPGRREEILRIVGAHDEVTGLHDLRTREAGRTAFIEMHLELPPMMSVREAHRITEQVEAELLAAFPGAEIMIHVEPSGIEDERLDHLIMAPRTA